MATQSRVRNNSQASRNNTSPRSAPTRQEKESPAENPATDFSVQSFIMERESKRRIHLHGRRTVLRREEAVIMKPTTLDSERPEPDMRFAENRMGYMRDPSRKLSGAPDLRFVENRPDILALHARRGETKPNLLFDEDGGVEGEGEEQEIHITASGGDDDDED